MDSFLDIFLQFWKQCYFFAFFSAALSSAFFIAFCSVAAPHHQPRAFCRQLSFHASASSLVVCSYLGGPLPHSSLGRIYIHNVRVAPLRFPPDDDVPTFTLPRRVAEVPYKYRTVERWYATSSTNSKYFCPGAPKSRVFIASIERSRSGGSIAYTC